MKRMNYFPVTVILFLSLILMANECQKEDPEEEEILTISDIENNEYEIVEIGTQWWMAENLKVTKYRNGDPIGTTVPADLDLSEVVYEGGRPAYQWAYQGNEQFVSMYGRLYTWFAVTDPRGLCPAGWHVPSYDEWMVMQNYLIENGYNYDGSATGNKIAKAMGALVSWEASAVEGTVGNADFPAKRNASKFRGLAAGIRWTDGEFEGMGESGGWFTSTNYYDDYDGIFWVFTMFNASWGVSAATCDHEADAVSVRCIKD